MRNIQMFLALYIYSKTEYTLSSTYYVVPIRRYCLGRRYYVQNKKHLIDIIYTHRFLKFRK